MLLPLPSTAIAIWAAQLLDPCLGHIDSACEFVVHPRCIPCTYINCPDGHRFRQSTLGFYSPPLSLRVLQALFLCLYPHRRASSHNDNQATVLSHHLLGLLSPLLPLCLFRLTAPSRSTRLPLLSPPPVDIGPFPLTFPVDFASSHINSGFLRRRQYTPHFTLLSPPSYSRTHLVWVQRTPHRTITAKV